MLTDRMSHIAKCLQSGEGYTVTAVGDSITYGMNHCDSEQTLYACLARLFAARFPENSVVRYDGIYVGGALPLGGYSEPVIVNAGSAPITVIKSGVGGDTVARAIARSGDFTGTLVNGKRTDMYLLMFGINDALDDPQKHVSPETYYDNLCRLCDLLASDTPSAEIILMTPTYNDFGETAESHLEPYVEKMRRVAEEKGYQLIDTHRLWMEHLIVGSENYGQRDWLSGKRGDSCHMSPEGSLKTAEFIFEKLDN